MITIESQLLTQQLLTQSESAPVCQTPLNYRGGRNVVDDCGNKLPGVTPTLRV